MSGSPVSDGYVVARTKPNPLTTAAVQAAGYADRLTLDGVQHGTLDGYRAGCRAELSCPARAAGASCLAVAIRYAGDWPFRRYVDAGLTEREAADRCAADDAAAQPAPARALRAVGRRSGVARGDRRGAGGAAVRRAPAAAEHGTVLGYRRGCHAGDPCPSTPTCAQAAAADRRRTRVRRPRQLVHGTRAGYARGCTDPETCPQHELQLPTCAEVGRAYGRERYRATRAAA